MARPSTPLLSTERIVSSATQIIDGRGLKSLTIRNLADSLGVKTSSIYNYFPSMEKILDAAIESVLANAPTEILNDPKQSWQAAILSWGDHYWRLLSEHSELVPLLAQGPSNRHSQLKVANALYGCLLRGGWPRRKATEAAIAIRSYISGSALASYSEGFSADSDIYAAEFPWLMEAGRLPTFSQEMDRSSFRTGLISLVKGLEIIHQEGQPHHAPAVTTHPEVGHNGADQD